jgi:hypothetical protein
VFLFIFGAKGNASWLFFDGECFWKGVPGTALEGRLAAISMDL